MKEKQGSALLTELLIATLFFSVIAAVLVQMFAASAKCSRKASLYNYALSTAQNIQEELYVHTEWKTYLTEQGFAENQGKMEKEYGEYSVTVELNDKDTAAGKLTEGCISAIAETETILSLPYARYIPTEATP